MSVKLKPAGKILVIAIIVTAGILSVKWYQAQPKEAGKAVEVGKVVLPDAPEASLNDHAVLLALPSSNESVNGGSRIIWERMAWNAQFSGMYANGGVRTTKGSLFEDRKSVV